MEQKINSKEYFVALPAKIKQEEETALSDFEEYKEISEKLRKLYEDKYIEVLTQLDENGKKLYPNDTLRKDAVMNFLEQTPQYTNLKTREQYLEVSIKRSEINTRYLARMFEMIKHSGLAKDDKC